MRRVLAAALLLGACSQPTAAPPLRFLDRPTDVAFGCLAFNDLGEPFAMPPASCGAVATAADAGPADGVDAAPPALADRRAVAFILESVRGDVAIADIGVRDFIDSDRFTPGLNGLAVGRLPTSVAISTDGCHAVVANYGSCSLSVVDVEAAYLSQPGSVRPLEIKGAGGQPLSGRPNVVVTRAGPPSDTGSTCAPGGSGFAYVAFEQCHLVARIDLATGQVVDGVHAPPGAAPAVVGPEITCPAECAPRVAKTPQEGSDAGAPDAGAEAAVQPGTLAFDPSGTRLYAGSATSGTLLLIDLDAEGRPTGAQGIALEGAGGIERVAASGEVLMGNDPPGDNPNTPDVDEDRARKFSFVYAVGDDGAIHVVDVTAGRAPRECDAQIDRRYLKGLAEREFLRMACFPVGDPANPPRRAGSRGPGIRLPRGVVPLDVTFVSSLRPLGGTATQPQPARLNGTFAFVTALGPVTDARVRGLVYVVNVDDDNYPDVEGADPANDVGLAIPHAVRDGNVARRAGIPATDPPTVCAEPELPSGGFGPVRLGAIALPGGFFYAHNGVLGDHFAPNLHRVPCGSNTAGYELGVIAGAANRDQLFPDLERTGVRAPEFGAPADEEVVVAWEGPLTYDPLASQRRGGRLTRLDSSRIDLQAPGGLLCALGAQDGDLLRLVGCNSDNDCAATESCVGHPDQPAGLNGMCVPRERASDLTSRCRDLLISSRTYTMTEVAQGRALLLARPAVLQASPIEGCTGDDQCEIAEDEVLARTEMVNGQPRGTFPRHQYACEHDPGMGGPPRCIPRCTTDDDCVPGSVCAGERCVLAPNPPPECVSALQRYEVRAGDAFVVLSSGDSFNHRQMVDPATGLCVENTALHPLIVQRVHRMEPACGELSPTTVTPNPCHIVDLQEPVLDAQNNVMLRPTYAMRVRSPGLSFDLTDVAFRLPQAGDALVSTISAGYFFRMSIAGGFQPYTFLLNAPLPERIRRAPSNDLWVVDSGDALSSLTRGQLILMTVDGVTDTRLR
jgi:hypothetical protein